MQNYDTYECDIDALCIDGQEFMGREASLMLTFINDKLVQVGVGFQKYSPDIYSEVLLPLVFSDSWQLVMLQNLVTNERFDFLYNRSLFGQSEAERLLNEFEQISLSDGRTVYMMIEIDSEDRIYSIENAGNVSELWDLVDVNTRELDFYIDENNEEVFFLINQPNLFFNEASEKEVENF